MKKIIFSLGGSLIAPANIDADFLRKFRTLVLSYIPAMQFVLFCGGGNTAREYQQHLRELHVGDEFLDWIGIYASRLNAEFVRLMFGQYAYKNVVCNPTQKIHTRKPVIVGAGWEPGWSTDYDAVQFAAVHNFTRLVNLSNVDYVYNKDPRQHRDARPIKETTWAEFRKIVGNKWQPGLNRPFDPIAAKLAQKAGLTVMIANGHNFKNLRAILDDKPFAGTVIH